MLVTTPTGVSSLVVSANSTWQQTFNLGEVVNGYWAELGKAFAMIATQDSVSPSTVPGCVFLGKVTKKGISSATKEGTFLCPQGAQSFPWYAVKQHPS